MAEADKLLVVARGIGSLNSDKTPSLVEDNQPTNLENMIASNDGAVIRNGSKVFKSNSQWTDVPVIDGLGYNLDESGAEIMFLLSDGKIYYKKVSDISSDPTNTLNPTVSYTLLGTITIDHVNNTFIRVLNNKVFICSGKNQMKYYGADHVLKTVADPYGYEITMTVGSGVAATIDATYEDNADTSRKFNVELTKVGGTGTSLILRQTAGDTRPGNTGTLNKTSGTGDANINWTAVTFSETIDALALRAGRLVAATDIGDLVISEPNDGTNFNGLQSERLPYGKDDGLTIANMTQFKRGLVLSLTDQELERSATSFLTGYRKYDTDVPDRTDGLFKIDRESNMIAIVGRSGLEVGNGFVGLTKNGFINFAAFDSNQEFGITDSSYISRSIKNIISGIDFRQSDSIRSCIDENNQRYWCAVPVKGGTGNTLVLVYDFGASQQALRNLGADHMWYPFVFSIGDRTITSMFTIFGHPFLGLSDGTVLIAEIPDYYYDDGVAYASSITTKTFDFEDRLRVKSLTKGIIDFIAPQRTDLEVYVLADENLEAKDWGGEPAFTQRITPRDINTSDVWTLDATDVWTLNPLDVWGRFVSSRNALVVNRAPKFREMALIIRNKTGGSFWGVYGYELEAKKDGYYFDARLKATISKVLANPAAAILMPLIPYLAMCYSII